MLEQLFLGRLGAEDDEREAGFAPAVVGQPELGTAEFANQRPINCDADRSHGLRCSRGDGVPDRGGAVREQLPLLVLMVVAALVILMNVMIWTV